MQLKKIWSIVCAVVLFAVLATGCGGGSGSASASKSQGSFELEGKTYTVPFALTDLKDNGWDPRGITWEELAEEDIGESTLSWVDLTKDGKDVELTAYILSAPEEGQKITDCQVYRIEAIETSDDPYPYSFSLSNGIKLRDTLDSVKEQMGEPTIEDETDTSISAGYHFDSENVSIYFIQSKDTSYIYAIDVDVLDPTAIFE